MSKKTPVWSPDEMRQRYGNFYRKCARLRLDRAKVPREFWGLLQYAEFWGISDDLIREELVDGAPPEVTENLKDVVAAYDEALDSWLAGPEADEPKPSPEYIAYSAMRMAAYFV